MASFTERLDAQVAALFTEWSIYSTIIAVVLTVFLLYPLFFSEEPDTHPLLLARQGRGAPLRNKGESAVYRGIEAAYGSQLKTGLNVKDPAAPKWTKGRDGDLRDVWRAVMTTGENNDRGKILTIYGKDGAEENQLDQISREINVIGQHIKSSGAKKVAVYLPNSVEYLAVIFACAFQGLSPVLLPYNEPPALIIKLLKDAKIDYLVASAGALPLDDVCSGARGLKQITWVVEKTSRHMDWNGAPESARTSVSVWHDLVQENQNKFSAEVPVNGEGDTANLIIAWQAQQGAVLELIEYTQKNIVAATAALLTNIPVRHRLTPSDLVLPADSFNNSYVLCHTFAALYAHSSLAINSVASPGVDLALASRSVSPTVIIASPESLLKLHKSEAAGVSNPLQHFVHSSQVRTLAAGRLPTDTFLSKLTTPTSGALGTTPGKLRLLFVSERQGTDCPSLSGTVLSDLRVYTRARICYALVVKAVAGALAQTNIYDYRNDDGFAQSHFGTPVSSVEVKLINKDDSKVDGSEPQGEVVAMGPAVVGGEARLGFQAKFRSDGVLSYTEGNAVWSKNLSQDQLKDLLKDQLDNPSEAQMRELIGQATDSSADQTTRQ